MSATAEKRADGRTEPARDGQGASPVAPPASQLPRRLSGYVEVKDRIAAFYEKYPDGNLTARILVDDGHRVLMKAYAYRNPEDNSPGIGHAEEVRGEGLVNTTSAVENCETSAWGRALAALGFKVQEGVASREEMGRAFDRQEYLRQRGDLPGKRRISEGQREKLVPGVMKRHRRSAEDLQATLKHRFKIDELEDLPMDDVDELVEILKSGPIPTGESDFPVELPPDPGPEAPPQEDIPFE